MKTTMKPGADSIPGQTRDTCTANALTAPREETESASDARPPTAPKQIEFTGWLPIFRFFGNCGHHPQFAHTEVPPRGYRFVRSLPPEAPDVEELAEEPAEEQRTILGAIVLPLLFLAWLLVRPLCAIVKNLWRHGPMKSFRGLRDALRLYFLLRRSGAGVRPSFAFVRTRDFSSQVLLPVNTDLSFVASVPYTYGQHPWVIEIEDATTLFYPFICNGKTAHLNLSESPYFPVVKALLEAESCRGIITHMRSTAAALPRMFQSEIIAAKTSYVQCGTRLPSRFQHHAPEEHVDLLFTCSWHQDPNSFFLRGGLEVLKAFEVLHERYPQTRLTLRTFLPRLDPEYRRIMEKCWVRLIDRFLPEEDLDDMMRRTHIFLLPAARIHVVSVLRAMAYGQVVVASDGWGFNEYLEHGRNGLLTPGRWGKASWEDEKTGMLREDYEPMSELNEQVVHGLIDAVSTLVEEPDLRRRLGRQARADVAERYTLSNWNAGLQRALDQATNKNAAKAQVSS